MSQERLVLEWVESEEPAIKQLIKMGYEYKNADEIDAERESYNEVLLLGRLEQAIRKLNPWIDDDNVQNAISQVRKVETTILIEANEQTRAKLVGLSTQHLRPITVTQDRGEGPKPYTVRLFYFDNPENNNFLVTNQFKLWGHKETIFPDIILFVNGMPLVVIECKSPTLTNPIEEAILDNLTRYQERNTGFERLFYFNHILVAMCGTQARYATINAKPHHYKEWIEAYPFTIEDIEKQIGWKPRKQEILITGMFTKSHLLDLLRNFVVYETEGNVRIKKVAKYQQFRAVQKALKVIREAKDQTERGGVIWHTQGSGKSLSMLWLALKIRREYENPTILFVTDRIQLDRQLHDTFKACGFPNPIRAKDTDNLETILNTGRGQTVMTTIFKFGFEDDNPKAITNDPNIFIMVDEAHRTQYKISHAYMRAALPNACYLGFTGTPIDKKERSTRRVFGNYIDKYTILQSEADGATLPIKYEGRMPELYVEGDSLEEIFNRVFTDIPEEDRRKIKGKYATTTAIAEASNRIKKIALDIVRHYENYVLPNKMKAMIVAPSRIAAVRYKEELDKLNAPASKIIMTSEPIDDKEWAKYELSSSQREVWAERFKSNIEEEPLCILIVVDMLLVGYDAPVLQVLYLDQGLKEHNLLQAIARVNRPYENKTHGLIVDYWGVSTALSEAFANFDEEDVEGALKPLTGELPVLKARHQQIMKYFEHIDRTDWKGKREIIETCVDILEPEDIRTEFEYNFKQFAKSMDMVLPDPKALEFKEDMRFLGVIRAEARTKYYDENLSLAGVGRKVRELIEEHIKASKITQLIEPTEITKEEFLKYAESWKSDKARASAIEHKLKHEITVHTHEDPDFYLSLEERLRRIIEAQRAKRISDAEAFKMNKQLWNEYLEVADKAKSLGFLEDSKFQFALYGLLKKEFSPEDKAKELTSSIYTAIKSLAVIDWRAKDDVQRQMRRSVKEILRSVNYDEEKLNAFTVKLIDLARFNLE